MSSIVIVAVPPGQAPDWVRQAWVGLEIPVVEVEGGDQRGVLGGPAENVDGYKVSGDVAISRLSGVHPKAANWWRDNAPNVLMGALVFKKDVCEFYE